MESKKKAQILFNMSKPDINPNMNTFTTAQIVNQNIIELQKGLKLSRKKWFVSINTSKTTCELDRLNVKYRLREKLAKKRSLQPAQ